MYPYNQHMVIKLSRLFYSQYSGKVRTCANKLFSPALTRAWERGCEVICSY